MDDKEEAHKQRLDQSNHFFQQYIAKEVSLNDQEFEEKLLFYLHDLWSVIRGNTFKFFTENRFRIENSPIFVLNKSTHEDI